ncbi:MAG: hypothetical protein K6F43_06665 [Prevotella sp.]|nr:hypothetical protein [Prevotella sp.]
MKNKLNILILAAVALATINMASCTKDDLGPSIFDTKEYPLDRNLYTFPLDTFVKVNFLEPYNMKFLYRMQYISSDKDKNLTPASYENSCKLAVLTKYLWYDAYKDVAENGNTFLKLYSPRIIHVIGSKSLNTSSGTETLGVTEGGTKVTLNRVNYLNPSDIDDMNEYFFETMHHEFGHILDNNKLHPTTFNLLSNGHYNAAGWSETPDSVAHSLGFVSPYSSASYTEDWVETLGRYITRDSLAMEKMYGTAEYEWEIIDLEDKNGDGDKDLSDYSYMTKGTVDIDTIGYLKIDESGNGEHKVYRRVCERDQNGNVVKDENGQPKWVKNTLGAKQLIEQKIDYVRKYMKEQFGIDLDKLRDLIQAKQFRKGDDGEFLTEEFYNPTTKRMDKKMVNAIVYSEGGKTVLDTLLDELNKYKELQNK